MWLTGSQWKSCCGLFDVPQKQMFFSQGLLFPDAAKHHALPNPMAAFLLCSLLAFAGKKFFSFRLKEFLPTCFQLYVFSVLGAEGQTGIVWGMARGCAGPVLY